MDTTSLPEPCTKTSPKPACWYKRVVGLIRNAFISTPFWNTNALYTIFTEVQPSPKVWQPLQGSPALTALACCIMAHSKVVADVRSVGFAFTNPCAQQILTFGESQLPLANYTSLAKALKILQCFSPQILPRREMWSFSKNILLDWNESRSAKTECVDQASTVGFPRVNMGHPCLRSDVWLTSTKQELPLEP